MRSETTERTNQGELRTQANTTTGGKVYRFVPVD